MSYKEMEILTDDEKRLLFASLSREAKWLNNEGGDYIRLRDIVNKLKEKFMYDRIFKKVYNKGFVDGVNDTTIRIDVLRADAIDELSDLIDRLLWNYDTETYVDLSEGFKESARLLKEQNK